MRCLLLTLYCLFFSSVLVLAETKVTSPDPIPGKNVIFYPPLSPEQQEAAAEDGNTPITEAKVSLAVPEGFDPSQNEYPVLVVSATSGGNASSVGHSFQYVKTATELGWVVIAADGPNGKPESDHDGFRLAVLHAGLDACFAKWPEMKKWKYACGGFSGGAKRSAIIAAALAGDEFQVIGLFQSGCNQSFLGRAMETYRPRKSTFKRMPIFISNGTNDKIAAAEHCLDRLTNTYEDLRMKHIVAEPFDGKHELYLPHVEKALKWFQDPESL